MEKYFKVTDIENLLDKLVKEPQYQHAGETYYAGIYAVGDQLDSLPVVEVKEQKNGTWRLENNEEMPDPMFKLVICSECNQAASGCYNFCPHCGTPMKGLIV